MCEKVLVILSTLSIHKNFRIILLNGWLKSIPTFNEKLPPNFFVLWRSVLFRNITNTGDTSPNCSWYSPCHAGFVFLLLFIYIFWCFCCFLWSSLRSYEAFWLVLCRFGILRGRHISRLHEFRGFIWILQILAWRTLFLWWHGALCSHVEMAHFVPIHNHIFSISTIL